MVPSLFRFLIRFFFSFSLPLCSDFLTDFWWRHTQLWCTDSRPSWWWQTLFWPLLSGCWAQRHASDDNYRRVWDSCNSSKPSPSRPQLQPQLRPFSSRYGHLILIASNYIFFFKRLLFWKTDLPSDNFYQTALFAYSDNSLPACKKISFE